MRVEPTAAEPAGEPEHLDIEAAQQIGPDEDPRRAQSDIERALEHQRGSVESTPGAGPAAGIAGFVEPASEDHDDGPRARPVEDG